MLVCRTEHPLPGDLRKKIALFCNVEPPAVVEALDAESIYEVPLLLREEKLDHVVMERLALETRADVSTELEEWVEFLRRLKGPDGQVTIALIGKYVEHQDAYKSISESFLLAGAAHGVQVDLVPVLSDDLTDENAAEKLSRCSGLCVAPGFGDRGVEGKIVAVRYARENNVPFLGICLGMQAACIEFARHVCGWEDAHSTEFDPDTPHPVIALMDEQKDITEKGGTMRLGAYDCRLAEGTVARDLYGEEVVTERHRHRYELNNALRYKLREGGLVFSGINPDQDLVEIIELPQSSEGSGDGAASPSHPWFVGVQFHPEYKSTVHEPHPLFKAFVAASVSHAKAAGQLAEPAEPARTRRIRRASARVLAD